MNGRLFVKRFFGVIALALGLAAFAVDAEPWAKAVVAAPFLVAAFFLFRRSARDDEWMRRYENGELLGQVVERTVSESMADRATRPPDPERKVRGVLVGATALHVLAAPFLMLRDLLKMQK